MFLRDARQCVNVHSTLEKIKYIVLRVLTQHECTIPNSYRRARRTSHSRTFASRGGSRDPKSEGDDALRARRDTTRQDSQHRQQTGAEQRPDRRVRPLKRRAEAPMLQNAERFRAGEPASFRRSSGSAANAPPASWSVEIMSCRLISVSGPRSSTRAPVRKGLRFSLSSQTLQRHVRPRVRLGCSTRPPGALGRPRNSYCKITQWSLLIGA